MENEDKLKSCKNCESSIEEDFKFCPNCGQATESEENLKSFFSHFLSDYFTFDSKISRSILPLITKPGFLTLEYVRGKKAHYIPPLRLYIFTSILFFLLFSWLNKSSYTPEETINSTTVFWDNFFESWLPKLFFVLLPIFALIISWLFRKGTKSMLPHFLFAFHFHSTVFLVGIIYVLISWVFTGFEWQQVNAITLVLFSLYLAAYLWKSLRFVFKESRKKTAWKYLVLISLYSIAIVVSSMVLLFFKL